MFYEKTMGNIGNKRFKWGQGQGVEERRDQGGLKKSRMH